MRELEVLGQGHLKLSWEDRKEFFEEELGERVRSEVKRLLEEALEAERTDWLGAGRYVRDEAGGPPPVPPGPWQPRLRRQSPPARCRRRRAQWWSRSRRQSESF